MLLAASYGSVAAAPNAATASVTGTVSYLQRIALSPTAVVSVRLVDVSLADAPATVLASQTITDPGQVPVAFELTYDPSKIDERMSYAVRAEIRAAGQLLFTTDQSYPVITKGNPNMVALVLVAVSGSGNGGSMATSRSGSGMSGGGTTMSSAPNLPATGSLDLSPLWFAAAAVLLLFSGWLLRRRTAHS